MSDPPGVITVARYADEDAAVKRAAHEKDGYYEHDPSERWPEYPYAVRRAVSGGEADYYRIFAKSGAEAESVLKSDATD